MPLVGLGQNPAAGSPHCFPFPLLPGSPGATPGSLWARQTGWNPAAAQKQQEAPGSATVPEGVWGMNVSLGQTKRGLGSSHAEPRVDFASGRGLRRATGTALTEPRGDEPATAAQAGKSGSGRGRGNRGACVDEAHRRGAGCI